MIKNGHIGTYSPFFANSKSDQRGGVAGQIILATGLASRSPGIFFLYKSERRSKRVGKLWVP